MAGQTAGLEGDLEGFIVDMIPVNHPNQDWEVIVAIYVNISIYMAKGNKV